MKKIIFTLCVIFFGVNFTIGQDILMTIDGKPVTKEEFKRTYLKNNIQNKITEDDLNNYLKLFINFKLKVAEAINEGYDTTKSFKNEYNMYLGQLADPYFIDTVLQNKLLKEAYSRTKKERRLSYILLIASPEDSAEVRKKAEEIYQKAINGADFETLVQKYSDSRQKKFDKGDAWYNGVFRMPYEIENFAYDNPIGTISKPIYANNAFFILKITGERTAPKRVRVSHIYVRLPKNPSEKDSLKAFALIDTIQRELKSGVPFEKVAERYSQDKATSVKGGDVGWFSTGRMFHSFEQAAYSIKNIGDVVGPIRTPAGYHFIKLTGRETYGNFSDEKDDLLNTLKSNSRYNLVKNSIFNKLKKEYNYKQVGSLNDFYTKIDNTIFQKKWRDSIFVNDSRILATFADQKKLTYADFAKYLADNQKIISHPLDMKQYIDEQYNNFINEKLKSYEITKLPDKNVDFKNLLTEYHDGLLLFDITNDKVWQKAIKDTTGLKNYYLQHKNKYYQKLNLVIYTYATEKDKKKLLKLLKKKQAKNYSDSDIVVLCNKKGNNISMESGIYKAGDNSEVDYVIDLMKNNKLKANQNIVIDSKNKKIIYIKDNFDYIKGLVTADYQNLLEKQWLDQLHKKYKVEINQEVWKQVKKELLQKN